MKISVFLLLGLLVLTFRGFAQFKNFVSIGYTLASEIHPDLEYFANSAKDKLNNGAKIKVGQKNRGMNIGFGTHTPSQGEFSKYIRCIGNLNIQGGKAIDFQNTMVKTRSQALDIMVSLGIMTAKGSTFYGLIGPSLIRNGIKISENPLIDGKYSTYLAKLNYGLGVAYIGESGSGLSVDAYCNFRQKPTNKFYETKSNKKLASDYASYSSDINNYQGNFVSNGMAYFRLQLTVFLSLSKK